MAQSDEKLIKELIKGNESAMEILVKRYYDLVYSFIYRNTSDYNTAYDITQDVFIKMMKNIDKYQIENGKFKSWLLKIAVNTTKDYFRSKIYKQRIKSYDIDSHEIEDKANVVDILSKKEETIKIKEAIKNLPKLQREAIILKYYNDLKIKEISNITGENENTIKSRLFNGVKNLKKLLGGDNYEERNIIKNKQHKIR
ncbi:RNA polymerase sigma factor [Paraclostridium sordellii]|uniref:RNA polymerase sigma factor n=1 Tax=Paraclostridium sordellii TaxID=1505 RepID=UPI0005DF983E|nr:RNA polymerase sigma factor [Paeniclostridium sordellii]AUN14474.1 RNA polymerase subunit sigma [Paeniclostridium sordellii]MBX9179519.1 RNA polymerase sigma factor [Paeniclostridium sordellii]MDU2687363.1 RNA polymerase sigma factor [Paeniclostridium sordellii]MVO71530.1 sigma-70 family RNA polymerase sigma factor [Paeniclostridium sordellii]CEO12354.1 sigma-70 family RNA polymerase sigma factor [[Clostridium] sordellii] [Paeniclostridium sordellii]